MKDRDKISDDYREQIENLLDNHSHHDSWPLLNLDEMDEIWEEISIEMDIDEIWGNISSDLDITIPENSGSGIIVKSIAILLVALIGLIPVKKAIPDSGTGQPDYLTLNVRNNLSVEITVKKIPMDSKTGEQMKEKISPPLQSTLEKEEDINKRLHAESNVNCLIQGKPIFDINETIPLVLAEYVTADSNLVFSREKIPIEKSEILPVLIPFELATVQVLPKTDFEGLKINYNSLASGFSLPLNGSGRISLGLITSLKNTWLLNQETLDGFKSESLNTTEFVFFPDVGLSMIYSLNKTWQLQADAFFSSNTGQEYYDYIYGHYTRKKITLNYSKVDLAVKHKFTGIGNFIPRSSINVLAGSYMSFLHYAFQNFHYVTQEINTKPEKIGSEYRKFDCGVRLGAEFELQIFDKLSLAPGLFLSLGIPNVYKGNTVIPGYLRRTNNGSAEFHLAFYHHFN